MCKWFNGKARGGIKMAAAPGEDSRLRLLQLGNITKSLIFISLIKPNVFCLNT
jgi:hypothetical protein